MTQPTLEARLVSLAEREYGRIGREHLQRFPLQRYLDWFGSPQTEGCFGDFPGELGPWFDGIAAAGGPELLAAYHRLAFCELMRQSMQRLTDGQGFAPTVREAQLASYAELIGDLEADPDMHLDHHHAFFRKDIHLCAMRMLATCGPCRIETRAYLSRRFLITGNLAQAARALRALLIDLRVDTKNLYSIHLEDRLIYPHFLEDGWERTYQDVAAQMRLHPEVLALHAASWFWDPQVKELNPKLSYLRDYPAERGASFFRLAPNERAARDALNDRRRRAAYEAGRYVPTPWLMIWPRRSLLNILE